MTKPPSSLLEVALPEVDEAQNLDLRRVASGQQLAQARSVSGLSAEALAERLRMSPEQILALEGERWDQLPDLTFVRAVLRAYARQIDVDVTPLVEHVGGFGKATVLQPYAADVSAAEPGRRRLGRSGWRDLIPGAPWLIGLGGVVGLVLVTGFAALLVSPAGNEARTVQAVTIPGISSEPVRAAPGSAENGPSGLRGLQSGRVSVPDTSVPVTIRSSGSMMSLRDIPLPAAGKTSGGPASSGVPRQAGIVAGAGGAAQDSGVRTSFPVQMPESEPVFVHFNKRAWIDISHKDGVKLLAGTQDANQSFKLDGTPPMDVQIGNPAGVTIEFRGKTVDLQSKINSKGTVHFTLN